MTFPLSVEIAEQLRKPDPTPDGLYRWSRIMDELASLDPEDKKATLIEVASELMPRPDPAKGVQLVAPVGMIAPAGRVPGFGPDPDYNGAARLAERKLEPIIPVHRGRRLRVSNPLTPSEARLLGKILIWIGVGAALMLIWQGFIVPISTNIREYSQQLKQGHP